MDTTTLPMLSKAEEVAEVLSMDTSTVHRYAREGRWPDGAVLEWGDVRRFRLDVILAGGVVDLGSRRSADTPTSTPLRPVQTDDEVIADLMTI